MKNGLINFRKMVGNGNHHVKQNKPDLERQISQVFSYFVELKKENYNKYMEVQVGMLRNWKWTNGGGG
jgi:hypothetical protein